MKDLDLIKKLLALLNETNAGTIEVRKNLWSTTIRVSKDPSAGSSGQVTYQVAAAGNPASAAQASGEEASGGGATAEPAAATHLLDVKSPMVGTFYAQPEPGAEPYVKVGSRIAPGQTLCIIEAMKIMNPIDAEVSGVVKEITVQDSQAVEFGQVLFRVDPNG
jgi:acetyl-CoA carboxylase biotin carboxyl carrier protein